MFDVDGVYNVRVKIFVRQNSFCWPTLLKNSRSEVRYKFKKRGYSVLWKDEQITFTCAEKKFLNTPGGVIVSKSDNERLFEKLLLVIGEYRSPASKTLCKKRGSVRWRTHEKKINSDRKKINYTALRDAWRMAIKRYGYILDNSDFENDDFFQQLTLEVLEKSGDHPDFKSDVHARHYYLKHAHSTMIRMLKKDYRLRLREFIGNLDTEGNIARVGPSYTPSWRLVDKAHTEVISHFARKRVS